MPTVRPLTSVMVKPSRQALQIGETDSSETE
jgi:hypothetical protein